MKRYLGLTGSSLDLAALVLVVAPAFLCYGYNQVTFGGLLTLDSFLEAFPQADTLNTTGAQRTKNSNVQGTVIALYLVGGIFGSLSCIFLGDRLGRRKVIFMASGVSTIGAVLMASSYQLAQFVVVRLVLGFGVVTTGFFIGTGITISLWVDFGFYYLHGTGAWRAPLALQVIFSLIVMAGILLLPESPRWLMKKGEVEEALEVLAALDGVNEDSHILSEDMNQIQRSLTLCGQGYFGDVFRMGEQRLLNRTVLAILGQTFQQMCGINAITFYATTIFQQYLGLDGTTSRFLAASTALTQPVGGVVSYYTIDRLGRRKLMVSSAAIMAALMAILAGTTSARDNNAALYVAVVALFLFPFIFTVGFAGLTFLYATEVAPTQHRAAINALSTAAVWTSNFLLAQVTPVGFDTIKYRYYIVFACINVVIVPTVYFFFPETKGLSLEQIDEIFTKSRNLFDPTPIARSLVKLEATRRRNSYTVKGVAQIQDVSHHTILGNEISECWKSVL
ncbi:hypothetical protein LTR70_008144 [Exophiala xenobiotica]|uniref:Major facilitator superfamily (MFS) profile domain-containing protein n=1 Tax=Lithohypha guttulata TaxID=1690604 RepID=A0ABR0K1X4_9EURO|nr:hypothetical protein LTR24_007731 [Lithohypha guttulata]KAK5312463.1 hypothetical protein LTR70_008144 [Exophiala xenobiotica]